MRKINKPKKAVKKKRLKWVPLAHDDIMHAQLFEVKANRSVWPLRIKEPLGTTDRMVRFNIFGVFLDAGDFVNVDGESILIVKKAGLMCEVLRGVYGSIVKGHVKGAKADMYKNVQVIARHP